MRMTATRDDTNEDDTTGGDDDSDEDEPVDYDDPTMPSKDTLNGTESDLSEQAPIEQPARLPQSGSIGTHRGFRYPNQFTAVDRFARAYGGPVDRS